MNARILGKLLGASAALALLLPLAVPASAQAWYGGPRSYGYEPDMGYPPAPGDQDYTGPPQYGMPQDYRSPDYRASQEYPPPGYPAPPQYGSEEEYQAQGYPPPRYAPPYRSEAEPDYGPGESYGSNEAYTPENRSLYRPPEVPPMGRNYTGSSMAPEPYRPSRPQTRWIYPRTGWGYPQAETGRAMPYRSERLVSAVDLNLRAAPGDMAPIRTVLPAGTPVRISGPAQSGWVPVETPFGSGWVYGRYIAPA
jgi:hypothetical protein